MAQKQQAGHSIRFLMQLTRYGFSFLFLGWKVVRWPFRHRRLPNRLEMKRFVGLAYSAITNRLKKNQNPITLAVEYRLWREVNCPVSKQKEGIPRSNLILKNSPDGRKFRVLYVVKSGIWDAATLRYRAYNLIEALKTQDIEAFPTDELHLPTSIPELLTYDLIVLARREWGKGIAQLALSAREAGIPIVADFDDYIFDEEVIPFLAANQSLTPFEIKKFMITPYRKAVQNADYFTGSIDYLCDKARALGKTAFSIPNGMNFTQIQLSEQAARKRQARDREKKLPRDILADRQRIRMTFG